MKVKRKIKGKRPTGLPDPGYEREEELKARTDSLEEQREELPDDHGTVDPSKMQVDNEIAGQVDDLAVSRKQMGFRYSWVWTGQSGFFIKSKQARGWEVVQGNDPESKELKDVTGMRRLGDVILMRIPEEKALELDRRIEELGKARRRGVTSALEDMARKYQKQGLTLHLSDVDMKADSPIMQRAVARAAARNVAKGKVTDMIKKGNIPGMPAPGQS